MFIHGVELRVERGDLLTVALPGKAALVNPANSLGEMGGGVAAAIRRAAGDKVEEEARKAAPIALGNAVLTTAGDLGLAGIIHAPTMEQPAEAATTEVVRRACRGAVRVARGHGIESLAFPGMGTGVGGLGFEEAAQAMVQGLRTGILESDAPPPKLIVLVAREEALAVAWEAALAAHPR